jgi:hypothetical protein
MKEKENLSVTAVSEGIPPEVVLATTVLGGFRGIFIDLLWLRAMEQKEEGNFYEMVQIYDWITNLQPNYSHVWKFIAWDLAYNVSVEINNLEDRWFWVNRGIKYLRNKGIPYNKYDGELYAELSWIFHHKIGGSLDYAHRFYRKELALEMHEIFEGAGNRDLLEQLQNIPDDIDELLKDSNITSLQTGLLKHKINLFKDIDILKNKSDTCSKPVRELLADEKNKISLDQVHLFVIRRRIIKDLHMEPSYMLQLNRDYGPLDWRSCDSHAVYWARKGLDISRRINDKDSVDLNYERRIYFSLVNMVNRGKVHLTDGNLAYTVPDYRFRESARRVMKDLIDRGHRGLTPTGRDVNLTGAISGYMNFLKNSVIIFYFNEQYKDAEKFMGYLREMRPETKMYKLPVKVFAAAQIKEFIDSMSMDRFAQLMESNLRNYFRYLAIGDIDNALSNLKEAKELHRYGHRRWTQNPDESDQFIGAVPPFNDLRDDLMMRILKRQDPFFPPSLIGPLKKKIPENIIKGAEEKLRRKQLKVSKNRPGPAR